jgi:predicted DNA-binding transcriptional regulator AlpA
MRRKLPCGLASLQTLRNYRSGGTGPPYYKVNGRSVRYKESEVAAWVEAFKVSPR